MDEKLNLFQKGWRFFLRRLCDLGVHAKSGNNIHGQTFCWSCYHLLWPAPNRHSLTITRNRENPYQPTSRNTQGEDG